MEPAGSRLIFRLRESWLALDPIGELVEQGRHDSSGQFSLDLLGARRKLGKISQAQPGLMLGKLVQAAVAGNSRFIRFTVGAHQISASLDFPAQVEGDVTVQKHLSLAFALAQTLNPTQLSWKQGGVVHNLREPGRLSQPLPLTGEASFLFRLRPAGFWDSLRGLLGLRHDSQRLLYERCLRCPIPVLLDNRQLNNPAWAGQGVQQCDVVELALPEATPSQIILASTKGLDGYGIVWLNERRFQAHPLSRDCDCVMLEVPEDPEVHVSPRGSVGFLLAKKFEYFTESDGDGGYRQAERVLERTEWLNCNRYFSQDLPQRSFRARTWVRMTRNPTPSTLQPVVDGLTLEKVELSNCPPGCLVIRAVSQLGVDLDQLNLIRDEAFKAMESELAVLLERCLTRWKAA